MVSQTQAAHINALIDERHSAVKRAFDELLAAYARTDRDRVTLANERFRAVIRDLKAAVATQHWPSWLRELSDAADSYGVNYNNGYNIWRHHLDTIINNDNLLGRERWQFQETVDYLFDVDTIIAQAVIDNHVTELYDKVIDCLRDLIGSGEIDSVRAMDDLRRITSTLERAKSSSFSSRVFSWQFARRVIPNLIAAYVKRSNITGPIIEAFEQTSTELDISLDKAKDQIGAAIIGAAEASLRTETIGNITKGSFLLTDR